MIAAGIPAQAGFFWRKLLSEAGQKLHLLVADRLSRWPAGAAIWVRSVRGALRSLLDRGCIGEAPSSSIRPLTERRIGACLPSAGSPRAEVCLGPFACKRQGRLLPPKRA
jgi:hypothetical protein